MHPGVGDLTTLTSEELHAKFADLNKKLSMAYRMGMGDVVPQIAMIISDYQAEIQRRNDKIIAELTEKTAKFKHIIDIT